MPASGARNLDVNDASFGQFLEACGSSGPLSIGVGPKDEMSSETRTFDQPFLVIGRRPESDLLLEHWQVSRRHAYLQLIEGRYYCVDLGSRTGTHGGDATERSGWLEEGRTIQIGPFAVRPDPPESGSRDRCKPPEVTWELPGRTIGQSSWRMDRNLVLVGRSPACRIRFYEPDVSKFHCSLVMTPVGAWVVDLLSQKGVFVNDVPARCVRLEEGDELRVGRHIIRARYDQTLPKLESRTTALSLRVAPELEPPGRPIGQPLQSWPMPAPIPRQDLSTFVEGTIDPTVSHVIQQFGIMQQQMLDQFHQSMMMMFEGFAALHRETSGTIRDEFEHVRKLSEEIESLRKETAKLAEASRTRPVAPIPPRPATNGHGPEERRPRAEAFEPITKPTAAAPEGDIHAKLLLRLTSIESERRNRWQKILGMMSSKS